MRRSSTYAIWAGMLRRCRNQNCRSFVDYGGRGITVCERWLTFTNFFDDMGERPAGLTLERVRNGEGYSKGNCVWATRQEQSMNTRRSVNFVTTQGVEVSQTKLAQMLGVPRVTFQRRLAGGWLPEGWARA